MHDNPYPSTPPTKAAGNTTNGLMDQASEAVQDAYGKARDVAVAGEDYLRSFIEEQPYTSALIALVIGVAIGYIAHQSSPPPRRGFW